MKKSAQVALVVSIFATLPLGAFYRAEMSVPILKTSPDEIVLTTSFFSFDQGAEYRVGIGAEGKTFQGVEISLEREGTGVSKNTVQFKQGFLKSWFSIDEIQALGYVFAPNEAPSGDTRLTLQVKMSRTEADRIGKFYIFVAKKYGPDTWYLEDGSEADKSLW